MWEYSAELLVTLVSPGRCITDPRFYVLEGTYTFLVGTQQVQTGGYAFVPREAVHAYTNSGDKPPRMLILASPGGLLEKFFAEAGEYVADPTAVPSLDKYTR